MGQTGLRNPKNARLYKDLRTTFIRKVPVSKDSFDYFSGHLASSFLEMLEVQGTVYLLGIGTFRVKVNERGTRRVEFVPTPQVNSKLEIESTENLEIFL